MFDGKTAVISGGAEGIGLGIARALGHKGMNIVLGDIDNAQLAKAESELNSESISVLTVKTDVTDLLQWQNLAEKAIERFGKIHMLVNNAGVASAPGPVEKTNHKDWQWVIDVNLIGVVNGMQTIVPYMKEHGEGGWAINVASMAGMGGVPYGGSYTATKVAVVGMSEAWKGELAPHDIKVSVLCPAFVKTRIHLSHRNRQDLQQKKSRQASRSKASAESPAQKLVENGIPADLVGLRVVEALEADEFYIFTHPGHRANVRRRFEAIDKAFERAAASPLLVDVDDDGTLSFE